VGFVPNFEPSIVAAVLRHMNDDHTDDSLLIVRAYAAPDATAAVMTGLDHRGGTWSYLAADGPAEITLPWSREISERGEIRREIVAMHDTASALLREPRDPADQSE
jgi:hypothetical protein